MTVNRKIIHDRLAERRNKKSRREIGGVRWDGYTETDFRIDFPVRSVPRDEENLEISQTIVAVSAICRFAASL